MTKNERRGKGGEEESKKVCKQERKKFSMKGPKASIGETIGQYIFSRSSIFLAYYLKLLKEEIFAGKIFRGNLFSRI